MSTNRGDTLSVLLKKAISIIDRQYGGQAPGKAEAIRVRNELSGYIKYGKLADENKALRAERDEALVRVKQLREDLRDAAQSLLTISAQAGKDELMMEMIDVRGYAGSRGIVASNALSETPAQSVAYIRAAGAREALERATKAPRFSGTVVRVDVMWDIIEQMEG